MRLFEVLMSSSLAWIRDKVGQLTLGKFGASGYHEVDYCWF